MNMWDRVYEICRQLIEERLSKSRIQQTHDISDECRENSRVFLVAIDGMCGSGKSTVASRLQEYFDCSLFHMDDFFLQPHQRTTTRLEEPGGNVDYERFRKEVLKHLTDKDGLEFQRFDCGTLSLAPARHVKYNRMVIIEGAYSMHPYFEDVYDVRIFLESSKEAQLRRILERSGSEMLERFKTIWIPMEEKYFEAYKIRDKCVCVRTG